MSSILEGTAVYKTPVSVDALMRAFQGRYYKDVTGDTPSDELQQQDLGPSEVLQEPDPRRGQDSWTLLEDEGKRTLVRKHVLPRLALFNPLRATNCPVAMDEMTGQRVTIVNPVHGGDQATIHDTVDVQRNLQDRWTGETRFELIEIPHPAKRQKVPDPKGAKRKAEEEQHPEDQRLQDESQQQTEGEQPSASSSTLTEALRSRGPNVVDGTPIPTTSGSSNCVATGCVLPGGHRGHHKNERDQEFIYDPYDGTVRNVEDDSDTSSTSSSSSASSTSSEELQPDRPVKKAKAEEKKVADNHFIAIYLNVDERDWEWLSKPQNRKKGSIWLSKKMSEKGKEVEWKHLTLEQKKEFDMAMAKEISNVTISKALRDLSPEERGKLDPKQVMAMRWVLTRKSDGTAKARLVVLGFQAHNITEVETASPTMSKAGRNLILMLAACYHFVIKSGDVTAAFLQTGISLEEEELTIWAPPELAAMFGTTDGDGRALRVREAFYGLCHAPRKWYEKCVATMLSLGWQQLKGDKCLYVLLEEGCLVGIAGLHVDDFLLAGSSTSKKFVDSEQSLLKAFRWGKWETADFEFAGCQIYQNSDYSIVLHQEKYTDRWVEEIEIDKNRSRKSVLTPGEVSSLRGALGTISWRATQTAPQFLADTSLLLSEINKGTVETLYKTNKLVREMRREAKQGLLFPAWGKTIGDLAVITWADASQHNRPDKSSTIGILTAVGPKEVIGGSECQLAVIQWKSGKTPRQCLGSNGAEVQAITIGEDQNYHIRMLMAEMAGYDINRSNLHLVIKEIDGALVMDSRGIYDAMTKNMSPLHGLRESRAGYELTLAVNQGVMAGTKFRWVNGLAQIGDSLTKAGARKVILQFLSQRQHWRLIHDEKFESGRKVHKKEMERRLREMEQFFINEVKKAAERNNWPWTEEQPIQYDPLT